MDVRVGLWRLSAEELMLWTVVLEKTVESPLDCKEIQPVHSEGDQPWDFFGRTDTKAETPVLQPPHAKNWLIGKDSDSGRDWGQEEKGMTEDEMAGWHHRLNGQEFGWTLGAGDGHGGLACCDSWCHRVGHDWVTELKCWWWSFTINWLFASGFNIFPWLVGKHSTINPGSGLFLSSSNWAYIIFNSL